MSTTADIRNGAIINFKNSRMKIIEFQHVKPGKGPAFVRTKLKNIESGKIIDHTFNSGAKIEFIRVTSKKYQYLYQDGDSYVFMDNVTFEGNTATNAQKPAKLETGLEINVPLFINEGDLIKIDTKTGNYTERVKQ